MLRPKDCWYVWNVTLVDILILLDSLLVLIVLKASSLSLSKMVMALPIVPIVELELTLIKSTPFSAVVVFQVIMLPPTVLWIVCHVLQALS